MTFFFVFMDKGYMSSFFYSMNLESSLINELLLNCFLCMFLQKSNYDSIIGGVNISIDFFALISKFLFLSETVHTKKLVIDIRISVHHILHTHATPDICPTPNRLLSPLLKATE